MWLEALVEGGWKKARKEGLDPALSALDAEIDFITAGDGVWVGLEGVSRFSFIKLNYSHV
jgi:hypothetical protein